MRIALTILLLSFIGLSSGLRADVWVIPIKGVIGPASADYLVSELEQAQQQDTSVIIIELDTPGGLDGAMRSMIQAITQSPVPVATYVTPSGARAASAGTFLLMASHVAAMAPGTNLGAASPVAIGGPGPAPAQEPSERPDATTDQPSSGQADEDKRVKATTTLEKKALNDAVAYIRALAELHGRNADWAETAVSEAASLAASDALAQGVIDLIATDRADLIRQLQGREIQLQGRTERLEVTGATIEREPDWRYRLLAVLTNPNVAYILMLVGIYGLILEFYNPGVGLPGVLGGICLLLAMYALQMLPINYAGLGLMLLGITLMILEALSPSFGLFGIGGVIAFALGSTLLMDSDLPGYQIALPLILALSITSLGLFTLVLSLLLKVRKRPVSTGDQQFQQSQAWVLDGFPGTGRVRFANEIWQAHCPDPLKPQQKVTVIRRDGVTLHVAPTEEES
ncbi:nodulation protein NfeD [Ferrimonas gelatinilytica]|uniref:Nodulation protein NfeD n=1 Tax=Ferrimonas gelatinilytica TaxID=1255257 RepID=A0ABP9RVL5_9GAMM